MSNETKASVRTADELRASEEKYRRLAESANAILWEFDLEQDRWTYVAPQTKRILGHAPEDWLDYQFWVDHIHPDDRQWATTYCSECTVRGEEHIFEYRFRKHDGTYAWLRDLVRVEMRAGNPVKLRGFMIDITSRKEMEEALQQSEENLRATLYSIGDGVFATDTNLQINHMNPRAEHLTGWTLQEAMGKKLTEIFHITNAKSDHPSVNPLVRAIKDGVIVGLANDTVLIARDGSKRQIADSASPIRNRNGTITGGILVFSDVSEQYEALERLRASEERFRLLAENAQDIIYRIRMVPDRRFEYVSPACTRITGYTPEEHYANPDLGFDMVHPDDRHILADMASGKIPADEPVSLRWIRKDGSLVWVEQRNVPIYEDGTLVALEGVSRDITKQKEAEERLIYLGFHDALTDLYNRTFFEEELRRIDTSSQLPISVIIVDVNGLKIVNDAFGHQTGDALLKRVAAVLKDGFRSSDVVARWGGDEFVILASRTDQSQTEAMLRRIYDACERCSTEPVPVSVAMGYGIKTNLQEDIFAVLKTAEDVMYKRKLAESASARSAIVNTLLSSLRARSHETEAHALRMRKMAMALGSEVGLVTSELDRLALLATLHDIGKITVPTEVLMKPGPLTAEEWALIKEHPQTGYRIAVSTEEFSYIAGDILSHHERWDGSGYPRGLKGEDISIFARITAVVDAYDAMTSPRPYSDPISHADAVEELKRCAGKQFDAELVAAFVRLLDTKALLI